MKKNFCKALAMLFVVFMMMNTVAFAETTEVEPAAGPGINAPDGEENIITVTLSGLTAGEEATILVVNDGVVGVEVTENEVTRTTTLADVEDTDIVYINQDTIAEDGTATFELDASNATGTKVDIFCGYTSIETAADVLVAEDVTISAVSAPAINTASGSQLYTKSPVTGMKKVFVQLTTVADAANWIPVHSGTGSSIYYAAQRGGYECLLATEAADLASIVAEIQWTQGTPTNTLKYGNINGDNKGTINALDAALFKRFLTKTATFGNYEYLAADVRDDGTANALDYAEMKKLLTKAITENDFTVLK